MLEELRRRDVNPRLRHGKAADPNQRNREAGQNWASLGSKAMNWRLSCIRNTSVGVVSPASLPASSEGCEGGI